MQKNRIKAEIEREAKKLTKRHNDYLYNLHKSIKRKERREGLLPPKNVKTPKYWALHPHFNPFRFRREPVVDRLAGQLALAIERKRYVVTPAVVYKVPKSDGTERSVSVYSVPDSAISNLVYNSLLRKNQNRFSSYSYAYRKDRSAHDAIYQVHNEWRRIQRVFIAEFDFSKFFERIKHDYLLALLEKHSFLATDNELQVVRAFLASPSAPLHSYHSSLKTPRSVGIPQGTSISLFLANLACYEMDRDLEYLGVRFVRYADDTLIWSSSYQKVVDAYGVLESYAEKIGAPINMQKSGGISLLTNEEDAEIRKVRTVDFLGYEISLDTIAISKRTEKKIKDKLSYIIYSNLVQPLRNGIFNKKQITPIDWDYVVAVSQVRHYLYGGLSNSTLFRYIDGDLEDIHFRGVMSYYPLVSDETQLKKLDGWLIHTFKQALLERYKLWAASGVSLGKPVVGWPEEPNRWKKTAVSGKSYDLRIPSFLLVNKAMRKAMQVGGIASVMHPKSRYYSS